MTIKDAEFAHDREKSDFLYHLRNCEPTHFASENNDIAEAFRDRELVVYTSSFYPPFFVLDLCINFVKKLASYKVDEEIATDGVFFASMPVAIVAKTPESTDRTLVWANGMVALSEEDELSLFLDKTLAERLGNYGR